MDFCQIQVSGNLAELDCKTQKCFQVVTNANSVRLLKTWVILNRKMYSVGRNLQNLGLDEEQTLLAENVEEIEKMSDLLRNSSKQ